jgi:L-histidine N-alpha-methyltransferase
MPLYPVEGDFTRALRLPSAIEGMPRLGFFPGSTIGNLLVPEAVDLLRTMATTLGSGYLHQVEPQADHHLLQDG